MGDGSDVPAYGGGAHGGDTLRVKISRPIKTGPGLFEFLEEGYQIAYPSHEPQSIDYLIKGWQRIWSEL